MSLLKRCRVPPCLCGTQCYSHNGIFSLPFQSMALICFNAQLFSHVVLLKTLMPTKQNALLLLLKLFFLLFPNMCPGGWDCTLYI